MLFKKDQDNSEKKLEIKKPLFNAPFAQLDLYLDNQFREIGKPQHFCPKKGRPPLFSQGLMEFLLLLKALLSLPYRQVPPLGDIIFNLAQISLTMPSYIQLSRQKKLTEKFQIDPLKGGEVLKIFLTSQELKLVNPLVSPKFGFSYLSSYKRLKIIFDLENKLILNSKLYLPHEKLDRNLRSQLFRSLSGFHSVRALKKKKE